MADELDAAPAVYALPAEPPETVTELVADQKLEAARDERDAARAELAEMERVREIDRESTLKLLRQHEADRAELAEVTAQRDAARDAAHVTATAYCEVERERDQDRAEVVALHAELAEVTADRNRYRDDARHEVHQLRAELAEVTAERNRLERLTSADRETMARLRAELVAVREKLADAALMASNYIAKADDLRAELATARRDAAADTLELDRLRDTVADRIADIRTVADRRSLGLHARGQLGWIADRLAAALPVPGSPQPAEGRWRQCLTCSYPAGSSR